MWHGTQLDAGLVVHREAIHEVRASLVVADHLYIRAGASQARDDFVQRPHAGNVPKVRRRYVDDDGSPRFCVKGTGEAVHRGKENLAANAVEPRAAVLDHRTFDREPTADLAGKEDAREQDRKTTRLKSSQQF